ncbi:hypothetical protein J1N35_010949 [Gossypium stocksii]|uniref:Uncharacterized protein n=1 Tax=Gossypium stocksii TaxID=47602 RepID=A0A9D3W120_9ROSI|nr:hypothetical protein J1N35_010949 [Gossypium stocksii]
MSQVFSIDQDETWITPIVHTLQGADDHLDKKELAKLQCKASRYLYLVQFRVIRVKLVTQHNSRTYILS